MPIINLLKSRRSTPTKSWEELAPIVAELEAPIPVPLPEFSFDPTENSPNVILELLPDPIPYLRKASSFILSYLESAKDPPIPLVTLHLSPKDGVASTSGGEMTLFIPYFANHSKTHSNDETLHEILGVILHELVHVYQHDGHNTVPGGLIEGVADFLRLRAQMGPPHWKKTRGGKWDAGYERTAYFLDWIESSHTAFVRNVNAQSKEIFDSSVFRSLTGHTVDELWETYQASFPSNAVAGGGPAMPTEGVS